ncbi:MAG: hypothetical protein FD123_2601 [Bacteroidetes bacterium]|nr:MAG: hypothetical protein FD123_2601 [Bacteroidota bacterium]
MQKKYFIPLLFLSLLTSLQAFAQPANDNPCAATALTVGSSCTYATYTNAAATASAGVPAPGCASYSGGDVWFSVVIPASGAIQINSATGVITDGGMAVYSGACGSLTLVACDDDSGPGLMPYLSLTGLTAGATYYIRFWEYGNNNNGTFQICVVNPCPSLANDDPCTATALTVNASCSYTTYTNACANSSAGVPAPGCGNYLGSDVWFTATVPASGHLIIDSNTGVMTDGGMAVYTGACGSLTLGYCDDDNSANGSMPMLDLQCYTAGTVLYIRFWEYGNNNNGTFQICAYDGGAGSAPANDLPCNAIPLSLGVTTTGNVTGATNCSDPATPSCWTGGTVNSVWYSVVCPASGQISVRTLLGTLVNTQIALFSGTCGSLTMVSGTCSDNVTFCANTQNWSEIIATGLVPGDTYYVMVDGTNNLVGDFSITAINGTSTWPIVFGQDCSTSLPVCAASSTIGNPGFIGSGNYCDFNAGGGCPTSCIQVGERNSVWYTFTTNAAGVLSFVITPNSPVDYDFALWNVTGLGSACSSIAAGTLNPLRCSYSDVTTATGLLASETQTCEGFISGDNGYVDTVNCATAQTYVLLISNYSTSTFVGFNINWGASPINYAGATSLTWTGALNTDWTNTSNWGGCAIPDCTKDIVIFSGPANQPVIPTGTTINCRSITIQAGASLTLQGTATLNVCGDFVNNGTFTAAATSTVNFTGTVAQAVNGSNSGTNSFGNFRLANTNTVTLNQTTDITGSLTTTTGTSVLNFNGQYVSVGGNFSNFDGGNTMTGLTGSTIEFNGTAAQTYNQGTSTLTLNNVYMNHTGPGLTLNSNMVVGTAGTTTLTFGKIITGVNEVQITNTSSGAITAGSAASFVQGYLRRYLNGAATSYNFPVGHSVKGYQLANITFTTATTIPQLLANFNTWGAVPNGPTASECPSNTYDALPALDNGYWQIDASANPASGTYNVTLYSTNYTNSGGAAGWTVMKSPSSSFTWALDGTCVGTSTASQTSRTGLGGFSRFGVGQSVTPLPVEFLSFTGKNEGDYNRLEWVTATEVNNDYFDVERSVNGSPYQRIGQKDGGNNSSSALYYTFDDLHPEEGINYYRLKQVDFNGAYAYSNTISIAKHSEGMFLENVRPNPTNGDVLFDFVSEKAVTIHILITDMLGRVVVDELRNVEKGRTALNTLIGPENDGGIYTFKVNETSTGYTSLVRLVKY